jgi:hypothetical protein
MENIMTYQRYRREGKRTTHKNSDNVRIVDKIEFGYLPIHEQLDQLWHDIDDGKLDKTGSWYQAVKTVKERFPKS